MKKQGATDAKKAAANDKPENGKADKPKVATSLRTVPPEGEADIKSHYEDQGFEVQQVNLIKDSDRHLSGYVKIMRASGIIRPQLMKNCVASMDVDSGKSIWECK